MKRTSDGYSVQIRIGSGRRPSFNVKAPDEPTFQARLRVMMELSRLLVDKGRLVEAEPSMKMLAAAGDDFDAVADGIRQVCSEPLVDFARPKGYAGMTFLEFGEEWTSGRLLKRFNGVGGIRPKKPKAVKDDKSRIETIARILGPVRMSDFSLDHFLHVMENLPETAKSDASRRAYAQVMSRMIKIAIFPCRIRTDNPLPEGSLPTVDSHREFQLLYPSEDAQLLACAQIDLFDRAFYGFSVRNGCRKQNFLDLRWQDIDFDNGQVWVPDTKTGVPVAFDLHPGCVRALRALRAIAARLHVATAEHPELPDSAKIFPQWHPDTLSERFREHLKLALGARHRKQLFETSAHQRPIVYHDLRASFITFALANGKSEEWIRERSGHTTSQMIARYRRPRVSKLEMTDWLPLDEALGLTAPEELRALPAAPVDVPPLTSGEVVETSDAAPSGASAVGDDQAQPLGEVGLAVVEGDLPQALQVANGESALERGDHHGLHEESTAPCGRTSANAHGVAEGLPVSVLRAADHERLAELLLRAGEWDLLSRVTRDRALLATARALLVERRRHAEGAPEGWQKPAESAPIRVATGVATKVLGETAQNEESSMFSALSCGTPGEIRTPDQLIRNQPFCAVHAREPHEAVATCARTSVNALGVAEGLPVSSLRADDYERLAEFALRAGEWELLARLARDRALIAEAQATRSNVTSLLVERRRRA